MIPSEKRLCFFEREDGFYAESRELFVDTPEKNLRFFVSIGEVALEDIVSQEKISLIREAIRTLGTVSPGRLKSSLGDTATYGEIRLVVAGSGRSPL